jgi:hypothetical protein
MHLRPSLSKNVPPVILSPGLTLLLSHVNLNAGCLILRISLIFAALLCTSCAAHRPVTANWRLTKQGTSDVLIPPDVRAAGVLQRTLTANVAPGAINCPPDNEPIDLTVRGRHARVTVAAKSMEDQPTGALATWASKLEATQCLAPGEGIKLAGRIAESVPLDPTAAFRLLNTDDSRTGEVDLGPQTRLQVIRPWWRDDGAGMIGGPMTVTGHDYHLTATANYTENLLGTETILYAFRPKAPGIGYSIVPLYADRRATATPVEKTGETTERTAQPAVDYLIFPNNASFYRLFYKSSRTEFTGFVLAARTPAELDRQTQVLEASGDFASCNTPGIEMCIAIPKDVAVNPVISVSVNGAEVLVRRGLWVGGAIQVTGERQPNALLHSLTISKPWNGRLIPVAFDPTDAAILKMPLGGGEVISWR